MPAAASTLPEGPAEDGAEPDGMVSGPALLGRVPRDTVRSFPHTKRVGSYLIGRMINKGAFAKVMEGLHIGSGEKVAVKVIDKKKAKQDSYVLKNMKREPRIHQMVQHPHVAQLYETLETENSYYMAMELCAGGDLMDRICERKRLDEREARRYTRQILCAVEHLHRHGIVHRDLKIENFLLDENNNIKIVDFGLSNTVKAEALALELLNTQCGSPAYAAPELLAHRKYGHKVDVWSVGVSTFAMLTGTLPFTVEPFNIKQLHQKMVNGDIGTFPTDISKGAVQFVLTLLEPDPDKRPSVTEAMQERWLQAGYGRRPLNAALYKNRLQPDELNPTVLNYMTECLGYSLSDVMHTLVNNRPSAIMATYCLLVKKLARCQKGGKSKKDAPSEKNKQSCRSRRAEQSRSSESLSQNPRKRTNNSAKEDSESHESGGPLLPLLCPSGGAIADNEIAITLENKESFLPEVSPFAEKELVCQRSPQAFVQEANVSRPREASPCNALASDDLERDVSCGVKPQRTREPSQDHPADPANWHAEDKLEKLQSSYLDKGTSAKTYQENKAHNQSMAHQETRFRDILQAADEKIPTVPWRCTSTAESPQTAPLPKLRHTALGDGITRKLTWVGVARHGHGGSPFLLNGTRPPAFPSSRQQTLIIKSLRHSKERGRSLAGPEVAGGGCVTTKRNAVQLKNPHRRADLNLPVLAPPFQVKPDKKPELLRMDF
ncbi:hormonally up-regulated neu tumor-associated kinase homolog [Brienomyrus brachyistius]|uniref:hormonally up-regulated neu tumor-associated kinase homolog n=1 Tax=Brienomyrus brachyistius TaxID=42636 RepID=UPI0020B1F88F|nr:hormonally up-regulated neu tumor-associated kinase homolog [Brienomyrus brachyistius]